MKRMIRCILVCWLAITVSAGAQTEFATLTPIAPDLGKMSSSNIVGAASEGTNQEALERYFQAQMDLATHQRHDNKPAEAVRTLVGVIESNAPTEFKRKALFDVALATQDIPDLVKAQQVYAQFLHLYPDDPSAPEVLLRQGLLYRQMGSTTLAISKFYGVMSTSLKLKLDNIDYYRKLVLQAQTEIADTYYLQGQFTDASDFYARLLKTQDPSLSQEAILPKLIRSLSFQTNQIETLVRADTFLSKFPNSADVPEVRFILASAYKAVGRNQDAMKQVLLLLQSQQENVKNNPEVWAYWQRRAGNEIANQLYKEGDYMNSLQIYQSLLDLDDSIAWKAPVWYQIGLIYEQLQQWQKATETYDRITIRKKDLTGASGTPSLGALCDMAQWRKDYIAWAEKARVANREFQQSALYSTNKTSVQ